MNKREGDSGIYSGVASCWISLQESMMRGVVMDPACPWLVSATPEQQQYWSEETLSTGQAVEDEIVMVS